jgi:hypothetical protein
MAKRIKCRKNKKRESSRYILKNEIRPGKEYHLHCCNMSHRRGIVWFRMEVWKLLGIGGGAGKECSPFVKKPDIQLTMKCREIQRRRKHFSNN